MKRKQLESVVEDFLQEINQRDRELGFTDPEFRKSVAGDMKRLRNDSEKVHALSSAAADMGRSSEREHDSGAFANEKSRKIARAITQHKVNLVNNLSGKLHKQLYKKEALESIVKKFNRDLTEAFSDSPKYPTTYERGKESEIGHKLQKNKAFGGKYIAKHAAKNLGLTAAYLALNKGPNGIISPDDRAAYAANDARKAARHARYALESNS